VRRPEASEKRAKLKRNKYSDDKSDIERSPNTSAKKIPLKNRI